MSYSVIIPTYNRAYCLSRAFDSVLKQTKKAQELIIVDDGSTDNTKVLVQSYEKTFKQKSIALIYLEQENKGVSVARNSGITAASTEWIALLDSDDAWEANKLEKQFIALEQQPEFKVYHTNEKWIRNGVRVNPMKKHTKKGGWIYQHCLPLCAMSPSSILIHKDVFSTVSLFDEDLLACEDYDLWLRITANYPVLYLEDSLTIKYGGHEDQLSKKHWGMDRFRIYALEKMLQSNSLTEENHFATKAMLKSKIEVFLKGAKKHGNHEFIQKYENP